MPRAHINGVHINYKVEGDGEPLVLIMGFGCPGSAWFYQTRAFKKYFRVVTFDNRGVGKTDKPKEHYNIETMADDTIGLMDLLGIEKAHVLGFSLGGMVAQGIAIKYPARVRRLILASTVSTMHHNAPELLEGLGLEENFTEKDLRDLDIGKGVTRLGASSFRNRLLRTIALIVLPIYARLAGLDGFRGQIEAAADFDALDRLGTIQAPTLVMVGTKDITVGLRSSEVMASRIPNARLVKIEGGAHAYVAEMSGRFNKEVLDFLRQS